MDKLIAKMRADRIIVASIVVSVLSIAGANLDTIRAISDAITTLSSVLQVGP